MDHLNAVIRKFSPASVFPTDPKIFEVSNLAIEMSSNYLLGAVKMLRNLVSIRITLIGI